MLDDQRPVKRTLVHADSARREREVGNQQLNPGAGPRAKLRELLAEQLQVLHDLPLAQCRIYPGRQR